MTVTLSQFAFSLTQKNAMRVSQIGRRKREMQEMPADYRDERVREMERYCGGKKSYTQIHKRRLIGSSDRQH